MDLPICIKTIGHQDILLHLSNQLETISDLRTAVGSALRWYAEDFLLIHEGQELSDDSDDSLLAEIMYVHEFINATASPLRVWAVLRTSAAEARPPVTLRIQNFSTEKKLDADQMIDADATWTVSTLKSKLYETRAVTLTPPCQKIIIAGKVLENSDIIGEYTNFNSNATYDPSTSFTRVIVMNKKDGNSVVKVKVMLVGGGHFNTTLSRNERVKVIKMLLGQSGVLSPLKSNFELYDATSRTILHEDHMLEMYSFESNITLLAVPSLASVSSSLPGRFGQRLSSLSNSFLPSAVDIFFPSASTTSTSSSFSRRRLKDEKKQGVGLFSSIRRGFFSDSDSINGSLKVKSKWKTQVPMRESNKRQSRILSSHRVTKDEGANYNALNNNALLKDIAEKHKNERRLSKDISRTLPEKYNIISRPCNNSSATDSSSGSDSGASIDNQDDEALELKATNSRSCSECNRKLAPGMEIAGKCRCGRILCGLHIHSSDHACPFDFKQHEKQELERLNQRVTSVKMKKSCSTHKSENII